MHILTQYKKYKDETYCQVLKDAYKQLPWVPEVLPRS